MPIIRDYTAENTTLRPTETGADAFAQAGRRIGAFYNQAGESMRQSGNDQARASSELARAEENKAEAFGGVAKSVAQAAIGAEQVVAHQEIGHGAAQSAQLLSNLTDQWNDLVKKSDPNDPTLQQRFTETVLTPAMENFKTGFASPGGKDWAEEKADAITSHMTQKTSADMSTLAGEAVKVNITQMQRAWTNTARGDPTSVEFLLQDAQHSVDGVIASSPRLTGVDAGKVRGEVLDRAQKEIVKAGALGAMEKSANPEAVADTFAKRYPNLVDAHEIDQFAKAARYYQRLNQSEDRANRVQQDYVNKQDFNTKVNALEAETMPQKAGDSPQLPADYWDRLRDLSAHPGAALEPGRLRSMVLQGEAVTTRLGKPEPLPGVSHAATTELMSDIRSGRVTDLDPIYKRFEQGELTNSDFKFLRDEWTSMRTPEGQRLGDMKQRFLHGIEPLIDKNVIGMPDPGGEERFYQFGFELERQMAEFRKSGKDPYALLDPKSPDYMGNPEALKRFQNPINVQLGDAIRGNGGVGSVNLTAPGSRVTGVQTENVPAVRTQADFDKLSRGASYIGRDGRVYRKP